jgi:vacuolar-type H+-ATPase subunit H
MKRIIEDVLQAEEKVGAIIKEARNEATEIRRLAEAEISQKTGDAKQKAREMVQTAVEEAKKDAERITKEKLELVDSRKDTLLENRADEVENLVGEICEMILTTTDKD